MNVDLKNYDLITVNLKKIINLNGNQWDLSSCYKLKTDFINLQIQKNNSKQKSVFHFS